MLSTGAGIDGAGWAPAAIAGDVWLSRNLDPLPRVRLARSWRTVEDRDELLQTLQSDGFDPREAVLLDAPPAGRAPTANGGRVDEPVPARETGPGRWEIDVPAGTDALVVVAESFSPDWIAEDAAGASIPVSRAEGLFLAFPAPADGGRVVLRHAPRAVVVGAVLSVVGLALLLGLSLAARSREARPSTDTWRGSVPAFSAPAVTGIALLIVAFSLVTDAGGWREDRRAATVAAAAVRTWSAEAFGAYQAGALEPAAALLRVAARRASHDTNVHYRLGLVHRAAGRTADARASFERAVSINPEFEAAHIALREMKQISQ